MDERFWGDMLSVLKDIGSYLEKQDTMQERAKIDEPPKMQENPKPIKGAAMPAGFAPQKDVAKAVKKSYVPVEEAVDRTEAKELAAKEGTFLKAGEEVPMTDEEPVDEGAPAEEEAGYEDGGEGEGEVEDEGGEEIEDEGEGEEESMDELKSLLKDIRNALVKQSTTTDVLKADLKKSLGPIVKGEADRMLRKMGLHPTRPDVQKLDVSKSYGVDTTEETKEIKKSADGKDIDMNKVLDDMSKKSWAELGQLREKTQGFSPFSR
jgi:hypothetical protein